MIYLKFKSMLGPSSRGERRQPGTRPAQGKRKGSRALFLCQPGAGVQVVCPLTAGWVGLEVTLNWAGLVLQTQECGALCLLTGSLGKNGAADSSFTGMLPALTSMADSMGAIGTPGICKCQGKGRACVVERWHWAAKLGRIVLCTEQPGVFMAC